MGQAACSQDLGGDGIGIGIADLMGFRLQSDRDNFVPCGEDSNFGLPEYRNIFLTNCCQHCNRGIVQADPCGQNFGSRFRLTAFVIDEFAGAGRAGCAQDTGIELGVLHHDDLVGTGRNGGSGHDFNCLSGANFSSKNSASLHFTYNAKFTG